MEKLKSLVTRGQAGDLDAYGEIVGRFQDMAYGYAYSTLGDSHLAEDVAQEAFIEAYRCLGNLREPAAFPGWFRRIVFKHCDRLRRRKEVTAVPLEAAASVASPDLSPAERAEDSEMRDKVLAAIGSLPAQQREVTTLFYINGYSQSDIAEFLEVPAGTVKSRLAASRNRLKERMMNMVAEELHASKPGAEFRRLVEGAITLQSEEKFEEAIAAHKAALDVSTEKDISSDDLTDSYWRLQISYGKTDRLPEVADGTLSVTEGAQSDKETIETLEELSCVIYNSLCRGEPSSRAPETAKRMWACVESLRGRPAYRFARSVALRCDYFLAWKGADKERAKRFLDDLYANLEEYEAELLKACPGLRSMSETDEKEKQEWFRLVGDAYHNLAVDVCTRPDGEAEALRLLRRANELREHAETYFCLGRLAFTVEKDRQTMLEHFRRSEQRAPGHLRKRLHEVHGWGLKSLRDDPEVIAIMGGE